MKKEILKLTGLTEEEFYKKFPTPDAFASAYPGYKKKLGGLTEAFPQIATADNFFSYGVPVPPTYYMAGGPVYPQIQTEAQFFSPVYSNSNNAYDRGGPTKKGKRQEAEDKAANANYRDMTEGLDFDQYDRMGNILPYDANRTNYLSFQNEAKPFYHDVKGAWDAGLYANMINERLGRQAVMALQKPFTGPYDLVGRTQSWENLPDQMDISEPYVDSGIDYRTMTPRNQINYLFTEPELRRGGSYTEVYPQAVNYGMGYSNYFMLADGGSMTPQMNAMASMGTLPQLQSGSSLFDKTMDSVNHYYGQYPMQDGGPTPNEPTSDQTFYTQKNNNFFDKLRKASYKSLVKEGMEAYSPYPTEAQEVRYGGMPSFQGKKGSSQVDNITNFIYPNRWRNWREKKNMGWADLTPEEQDYIKAGTADLVKLNSKYRRAIQRGNRLKELTAEFEQGPTPSSVSTSTSLITPGPPPAKKDDAASKDKKEEEKKESKSDSESNVKPSDIAPSTPDTEDISAKSPEEINEMVAKMQEEARKRAGTPTLFGGLPGSELEMLKKIQQFAVMAKNGKLQTPSNTNSMDDAATRQKKAGYADPGRYVNQDFVNAQRAANQKAVVPVPASPQMMDQNYIDYLVNQIDFDNMRSTISPPYNPSYRRGGPYVLPMYQGRTGPGQVMTDDPFGGSLAQVEDVPNATPAYNYDTKINEDLNFNEMADLGFYEKPVYMDDFTDRFKVGFDVSKVKKFSPYFAGAAAGLAALANSGSLANQNYIYRESGSDKMFNPAPQDQGDYFTNEVAGQYFRPNAHVPVQSTGYNVAAYGGSFPFMYDTADLYFLTPQMLKKTRNIS